MITSTGRPSSSWMGQQDAAQGGGDGASQDLLGFLHEKGDFMRLGHALCDKRTAGPWAAGLEAEGPLRGGEEGDFRFSGAVRPVPREKATAVRGPVPACRKERGQSPASCPRSRPVSIQYCRASFTSATGRPSAAARSSRESGSPACRRIHSSALICTAPASLRC